MKFRRACQVSALSLLLAAAPPPVPSGPLQPVGPWTANFEQSMCLLGRKFGPDGETSISFRPAPLNDGVEILILHPPTGAQVWRGKAQLRTSDQASFEADYMSFRPRGGDRQATFVYTKQALFAALGDDGLLTVRTGARELTLHIKGLTKALGVVAQCKEMLLKSWGIEPGKLAAIATRAVPADDPPLWVTTNDYPDDALRKGQSGRVTILWTIGADGKARDCRIMASSGVESLDRAACKAMLSHARYKPARDAAGAPVEDYDSRGVNWMIPSG